MKSILLCTSFILLSAAATVQAGDQIQIPVRWCALDGSPAVINVAGAPTNPYTGNPEPDTDAILWRRHERASDNITIPGASLTFRSGFTAEVRADANFPIIPDSCPPVGVNICQTGAAMGMSCTPDGSGEDAAVCGGGVSCAATTACPANCTSGCVGQLGDIAGTGRFCNGGPNPGANCNNNAACGIGGICANDLNEYNLSINVCTTAWDQIADDFDTPLLGPVAVNVGNFVNPDSTVDTLKGRATGSTIVADDLCSMPPTNITSATGGAIVARDNQNLEVFEQTNERMVAHELGHDLYAWHGDGIDNDTNGAFDQVCDSAEDTCATPTTFMSSSSCGNLSTSMTSDQRDLVRAVGVVYTGATQDPPGVLLPSVGIGDEKSDTILEISDSSIDIRSVAFVRNTRSKTTDVLMNMVGRVDRSGDRVYLVGIDTDNNVRTGLAEVREIGNFQAKVNPQTGIDVMLVARVFGPNETRGEVFRIVEGRVQACGDDPLCRLRTTRLIPVISGDDDPEKGADTDNEIEAHAVAFQVATQLLGNEPSIKVWALAADNRAAIFDTLPNEGADPVVLRPVPPQFPVCFVDEQEVRPGDIANFNARKLHTDSMVKVILGDRELGSGQTDAEGNFSGQYQIPFETRAGERLVTIGVAGQAMSADCPLIVVNKPRPRSRYEYAAKTVCGTQDQEGRRHFIRGVYATTVNAHNPNQQAASIFLKFAQAYPERTITPLRWDRLAYDQALAMSCDDLDKLFPNDTLIDGFLVLQSDVELDVSTVTTSGGLDRRRKDVKHESIDIERVPARKIVVPQPDLIVQSIDPESISVSCSDGACTTKAKMRIKNIGLGNAGSFSTETRFDPDQSERTFTSSPGLTAGSAEEIEVVSPGTKNCFGPDCTVCATVDIDDDVAETDEGNNTMCVTKQG